jgi:hypothetical protein
MIEISRLAASLAERILMRHKAGVQIPPELFRMLVTSAQFMHENNMPWPASVEFVLAEVARRSDNSQPTAELTGPKLLSISQGS